MTVRERFNAALRCGEVDYIPFMMDFWDPRIPDPKTGEKHGWTDDRERLAIYREIGWDAALRIGLPVTPLDGVRTEKRAIRDGDRAILCQKWITSAGTIEEKLQVTDDWPEAAAIYNEPGKAARIAFNDDFRTPRYIEMPFKTETDLDTLPFLFPQINPADEQALIENHRRCRAICDEFEVPLIAYMDAGLDWLIWLFRPEEAIMLVLERPDEAKRILSAINGAKRRRLEILLDLGVDAVIRRGWYESTDFWNPQIFRAFAVLDLKKDIEMARQAGAGFVYQMVTGLMPLLDDLAALDFDCLYAPEPALGHQDLRKVRACLPGKSIWGGISGPGHLAMGSPEDVTRAVEEAFEIMGRIGFILGSGVGFRGDWPLANLKALDGAWRRLR